MLTIILIVLLILWLLGTFPRAGGYSANFGYGPAGIGTVVIVVVLILLLTGRL